MSRTKVMGTQSIQRATLLMKAIAADNHHGVRLIDLANKLPIDRTTIHRIVKALVADNLIAKDPHTHRYYLGQALFELGLSASSRFKLHDMYQPILANIADKTGDTVFLNIRSGNEAVCIDRKNGSFPIKVFTLDVGDRRPLGTSASGLAILSALPDKDVRQILNENESAIIKYKNKHPRAAALLTAVKRTQERGYALHRGDLADIRAIAVPVKNKLGTPFAAISVTAISSRMSDDRHPKIAVLLKDQARELEKLVSESDVAAWMV